MDTNTTYYVRAFAYNEAGLIYSEQETFVCTKDDTNTYGELVDIEGNKYKTVKIGQQWWMAENLAVTKMNDGTNILFSDSNNLDTSSYYWKDNDSILYKGVNGALYNYPAIQSENLCPQGWHVPSDLEWIELEMYLGMDSAAAFQTGWRNYGQTESKLLFFPAWEESSYYNQSLMLIMPSNSSSLKTTLWSTSHIRIFEYPYGLYGRFESEDGYYNVRCIKND